MFRDQPLRPTDLGLILSYHCQSECAHCVYNCGPFGIERTGMELNTSKKIVEMHGGEIWAESGWRNKGSKFYFSLPISKP
ncbi:MAG: ATP-binding protein [Candidatus Thorarchaeota archaeon]